MQAHWQPGFRKRRVAPVMYITMKGKLFDTDASFLLWRCDFEPSSSLSQRSWLESSAPPSYCSLLFEPSLSSVSRQRLLTRLSDRSQLCSKCISACSCYFVSRCEVLAHIITHVRWLGKPEIRSCLLEWGVGLDIATSFSSCSQILSNIFCVLRQPLSIGTHIGSSRWEIFWTDHGSIPLVPDDHLEC